MPGSPDRKPIRTSTAILIAATLACPLVGRADTLRVLFLGNSHTYTNNLPQMFAELADSGGRAVVTDQNTPGGWTLEQHSQDSTSLAKVAQGGWNYVVLQEQSQIPSILRLREVSMYPAVRRLDSLIRATGCSTALFMTWGWKNGGIQVVGDDTSPPFRDYFEMQDSVAAAYERIADEIGAKVLPVGLSWARARRLDSLVDLWQPDNSHAKPKGTYIGACTFYAAFFHASPVGIPFYAGLTAEDALFCQQVAEWTVLGISEGLRSTQMCQTPISVRPNPFAHTTAIGFPLNRTERTDIEVFDAQGRKVRTLIKGAQPAGFHDVVWDARDDRGKRLDPGIYVVVVRSGSRLGRKKLVLTGR